MKKIEKEMLQAIESRQNFRKGNTQVIFAEGETGRAWWCNVYLYGNHIAEFDEMTWKATVNKDTLRAWPTVTTKSRLRALGADVSTQAGVTYLDGQPV